MKKIAPRRVTVHCENCGELNTIQRFDPMGCPKCDFPVKIIAVIEEPKRKSA